MSKLNIVRRCHTCGAILQTDDPNGEGYITPEILEQHSYGAVFFCNKCYDESRYNFVPRTPKVSPEFLAMIQDADASDALIVYIVDLFSFENSFIPEVTEMMEGLNVLVVANKRDLLPKNIPDEDLREYVAHRCRNARLRVTRDDVVLASLTSMGDVSEILGAIETRRKRHDVYILGATGSGKTQLISSFLHSYSNQSRRAITTANYPGTNLRVMQIPLDTSSFAYETPGTSVDNTIETKLDFQGIKAVTPTVAVKARTITVDQGDAIYIGGAVRIELLEGKRQEVKCYFAAPVTITKSRGKNLDAFFRKASSGSLVPTLSKQPVVLADFDAFDISVEEVGPRDIGVAGLGWISFQGDAQKWRVFTPKNVAIYVTRAKIK